jgi:hypothetical protein
MRRVTKRDPIELHPVTIATSKARALAWTLRQLGEETAPASVGANNLLAALSGAPDPEDVRGWLHIAIADALDTELGTIEREFRKSLTPEQVREQVIGGPKAVA